jgi:hypothetical protein
MILNIKDIMGSFIHIKIFVLYFLMTMTNLASESMEGGKNITAFSVDTETSYVCVVKKIEDKLKKHKSKYLWDDYIKVLDELSDKDRYVVCTGSQFTKTKASDKIVVYLRHDIDYDPITALKMAMEEKKRRICSAYYVLPTAHYYGTRTPKGIIRYACMDKLYHQLADSDNELGVHNDLFTMMLEWDIDPIVFQRQELEYYHRNGFKISGCVSHGSWINKLKINNTWIFSEFGKSGVYIYKNKSYEYGKYSLSDFGFSYEGYLFKRDAGFSDISGYPTGETIANKLRLCKIGDRVTILIHPCHWRS